MSLANFGLVDLSPQRTKIDIGSTYFSKAPILDYSPLDPKSYKLLEPKTLDRHQRRFNRIKKRTNADEMQPAGFKPRSNFFREECNPLDRAPTIAIDSELDGKLKKFYRNKERKFSVTRPIDSKESFIASGGPSMHFVSSRELGRQKFLSPFGNQIDRDKRLVKMKKNDLPMI